MSLQTCFIVIYFATSFTGEGNITETMFVHVVSFKIKLSVSFEITLFTLMRIGTYIN